MVVTKIRKALYRKITGLAVIKYQALYSECLEIASITKYSRKDPSAWRGTENLLQIPMNFVLSILIFFIYFLSWASRSSTCFSMLA